MKQQYGCYGYVPSHAFQVGGKGFHTNYKKQDA